MNSDNSAYRWYGFGCTAFFSALSTEIAEHGARTPAEAVNFLAEPKKSGRYQTDVY